ncbi:MAG: FAD binding domain-containing protein [Lachnospiraceae bacterium]|nr:FAD binding domain-containing protein [Lachnospiraceae bacterium]
MVTIREYKKSESLEEAWELNQKKSNRILGGMLWLRQGNNVIQTAIDLSGLGLDTIEETDKEFRIGCMVSLRELEQHAGLTKYTGGAMREALRHIVGVQFRNLATVGGSIFGRFGFSDVLTMFLTMDSYVELYKGGIVSLEEFAKSKPDNDILVRLIVKKEQVHFAYQSVRNTQTDFPVLTCGAAKLADGSYRFAIGARPGRAVLFHGIPENLVTGTNLRGSAEYRKHLADVLVKRTTKLLDEANMTGEER